MEPKDSKIKRLVLIDTNALMHRAYHALPPLTDKNGQVVNAVYGFSSLLIKILKEFSPDYILCTFDMKAPTFRHNEFDDYKAHRVKAPEEFYTQIPKIKQIIQAFGIPCYEKEGFEADDVIGTISHEAPKIFGNKPFEIIILTGDLDTLQLINDSVIVYTFKKGITDTVIYDEKAVKERYGLKPNQMIDFKGLRGDPSDNIPGVSGIGEKTAVKLLEEFGSIDYIYNNLDKVKEKVKPALFKKLEESKEQANFSKYLATIRLDVPLDFDLETARVKPLDQQKIAKLFQEFNFFSLIKRLGDIGKAAPAEKEISAAEKQFPKAEKIETKIIKTPEEIGELHEYLKEHGDFAFDLKYEFKDFKYSLLSLGIASKDKTWEINFAELREEKTGEIKKIFEDQDIRKTGHDVKTSIKALRDSGIELVNYGFDTMIGAYLLVPGKRDYGLDKVAFEYLGVETPDLSEEQIAASPKLDLKESSEKETSPARRAAVIMDLAETLLVDLERKKMATLLNEIEIPLIGVLSRMEMIGVKIDTERLNAFSLKIGGKIEKIKKEIFSLSGEEFNVNSTRELSRILFEKLGIPTKGLKKTKTDYSTAADTLEQIKLLHPIVKLVIQYRELAKIKSTYADALPALVNPRTECLHTTFNQALTATGRLSSSDPNLQNIPVKTDIGNEIRMAFIPCKSGRELLSFDYSQVELRIVASMANDRKMIGIFTDGGDIHRETAAEVYEVDMAKVTDKMRYEAKALNFGIIYGMSVHGFAEATGMSRPEAKDFIDKYLVKFSGIDRFRSQLMEEAKNKGYAQTIFGRRRLLPELRSPNFQVRAAAERMAINMPIQGTAADIIKLAMIAIDKEIRGDSDISTILQVHDELVFEVKKSKSKDYAEKIKKIMETVYLLKAPLKVSVSKGENWGEMKEI